MKDPNTLDSCVQKESLINEYKGNIFEYLVGNFLANIFGIEGRFFQSMSEHTRKQLAGYENWLRDHDLALVEKLPVLAHQAANELAKKFSDKKIQDIFVVGKLAGNIDSKAIGETDILLKDDQNSYPISLKLCKAKSYVNTKSAGIKSFLKKYFNENGAQEQLNSLIEKNYTRMVFQLYETAGLECVGVFDYRWQDAGLPELPGQLPQEMRIIVHQFYAQVMACVHQHLQRLAADDLSQFKKNLFPLIGLSNQQIIQASCFYDSFIHNGINDRYNFKEIKIIDSAFVAQEISDISIGPFKNDLSSFEIKLRTLTLQIRVKPMNKFTTMALKVNCSLRHPL